MNADGSLTPVDALMIINAINDGGDLSVPPMLISRSADAGEFVDVSGDRMVSPIDALMVINQLNLGGVGEFESPDFTGLEDQHGDRLSEATPLRFEGGYAFGDGVIGDGSDVDVFSFEATSDGRIGVGVGAGPSGLALKVFSAEQSLVAASAGSGGFLDFEAEGGGAYFVAVSKADPGDDSAVPFFLDAFEFSASAYQGFDAEDGDQHGDTPDSATDLALADGAAFVQSEINFDGDVDVFRVTTVEGILAVSGYFLDPAISQFEVNVTDDDGVDVSPRGDGLGYDVAEGAYVISITGPTGAYILDVYSYSMSPWLNDFSRLELTPEGYFSQPVGFLSIGNVSAPYDMQLLYLGTDGSGKLISSEVEADIAYAVVGNGEGYRLEVNIEDEERLVLSLEKLDGDATDESGVTWLQSVAVFK